MNTTALDMYNMIGTCPEDILASEARFALRNLADASDSEVMALQNELISFLSKTLIGLGTRSDNGIVLHSGSEANEIALLLAKRATKKKLVIASNLSHTSISNSCQKLDLKAIELEVDRPSYQVSSSVLNDTLVRHGDEIALLNITYGTTKLGSQQDFIFDQETIDLLELHNIWVHVDAAYGGFMLSLCRDEVPTWKTLSTLKSITVDTHKFVGAIGCGVLLLPNNEDKKQMGAEAVYFEGNASALGTTRSAYPLATAVATIQHFKLNGLRELARESHDKAIKLTEKADSLALKLIIPVTSGVVPIQLSDLNEVDYFKNNLAQEGYKVSPINIPFNSGNTYGFRVVVTPKELMTHTTLDAFAKTLGKVAPTRN